MWVNNGARVNNGGGEQVGHSIMRQNWVSLGWVERRCVMGVVLVVLLVRVGVGTMCVYEMLQ